MCEQPPAAVQLAAAVAAAEAAAEAPTSLARSATAQLTPISSFCKFVLQRMRMARETAPRRPSRVELEAKCLAARSKHPKTINTTLGSWRPCRDGAKEGMW